jgi:hypothetical protein
MASTSKYIQIDPQILLEYIYTDQLAPEVIQTSTTGNRILILDNQYTGSNFLFNEDNPAINTGNTRFKSAIPVNSDKSRYSYLTNKNVLNYLDFDENLDSVNDLLSQLTSNINNPVKLIQYDTIRLHFISGFSFEDKGDGFIFEALIRDRNLNLHNILSIVYRQSDSYEINNPSPFISNEKLYTKYIEVKVPALNYLVNDYVANKTNPDAISNLITNGFGLNVQNTLNLSLKFIKNTEVINGQTYFNLREGREVSVNKLDEYSGLSATIEESLSGDFFELYGEFNGSIYENFIIELNNRPNTDLIVVHDIIVLEQVGTNFTKTSEQSFIQTDDFSAPYRFRPIILNSHVATSYRINYTLRILNKIDNSQIIRQSQYSSFDVKKYGRRIRKLNLGTVPTVTNVFNKVFPDTDNILLNNSSKFIFNSSNTNSNTNSNISNSDFKQTEFVMGFNESINISSSISTVKTEPSIIEEGDIVPSGQGENITVGDAALNISDISGSGKIYGQSEGYINITPFDNFIKFVLYNNSESNNRASNTPELLDLTKMGSFYITFIDKDNGDEIRIENYTNIKGLSPANGELVFKISKEQSRKILKFNTNSFFISSLLKINDNKSDETMVYTGIWLNANEKPRVILSENIEELENTIEGLTSDLQIEREQSDNSIRKLEREISALKSEKRLLENRISELNIDVDRILEDVRQQERNTVQDKEDNINTVKENKKIKGSIKLVKDKIDKGLGKFVSPKSFENVKGLSAKTFKINK